MLHDYGVCCLLCHRSVVRAGSVQLAASSSVETWHCLFVKETVGMHDFC